MTQRLEGDFRDAVKNIENLWYIKLQTFPGAFTDNPGDFFVFSEDHRYLIECKECRGPRYVFDRLTQESKLIEFEEKFPKNHSYVLICFWEGRKIKSFYYLIPISKYLEFKDKIPKKSASKRDFTGNMGEFQVNLNDIYLKFR